MLHPRLELAVEAFEPLAGPVLVLGPTDQDDLSAIASAELVVVQSFFPDHAALKAQGYTVVDKIEAATGRFGSAVVFLPRSKPEARAMLAAAADVTDGPIWVDGAKTDGVDSIYKDLRKMGEVSDAIAKAHGKIFVTRPGDLSAWAAQPTMIDGFVTRPGVFSEGKIDRGSALLVQALPDKLPSRMADYGAGWGYLSKTVLDRKGVAALDLVEADGIALDCARQNITDERASFVWTDATTYAPKSAYAGIVMNPPFHTGRAGDPALGKAFIASAARGLTTSGHLWMVANRHLPYEAELRARFREVEEIGGDGAFKIFHASRPIR